MFSLNNSFESSFPRGVNHTRRFIVQIIPLAIRSPFPIFDGNFEGLIEDLPFDNLDKRSRSGENDLVEIIEGTIAEYRSSIALLRFNRRTDSKDFPAEKLSSRSREKVENGL